MDFGKYFSGFFTHSLTRSVNENQGSFEDRESYFLLVLKRNSDGDKIYKGLKDTKEFNIYELTDLNSPRNLIYLVISLRFTNEKISIKAEELQPKRDNNLFWGDWPPSYSWVFFLGNILFYEITQFESWDNVVINLIALHNGESLFELYEKSTRVFSISGDCHSKRKEPSETHLERIHENEHYGSIPRLFNILCEWCDYFGPNIMTIFWLLLVFSIISMLIFSINIISIFGEFFLSNWLNYKYSICNLTYYSKKVTPYLILMIPIITSIGLIFLKSILDDFPLPKHNQEDLIYFSNNAWRTPKKKSDDSLNLLYNMAVPILIISIYIPLSNQIEILKNEFFKFMLHLVFSLIIFQITSNIQIKIDVSRETYDTFWSFKLPLIIKSTAFFFYWAVIRQLSNYFYNQSIDYFPFAISLIILTKNVISVINSMPYSKNCIGFKLGPKEEMKRLPLGDFVTYSNDFAFEQPVLMFGYIWNNFFYTKNRYTLYEDMWHYNLLIAILLSICAEYPVITSLILMANSILTIILLFSKILTDSTRPWLLNITLSHQLWKFIIDSSILFSISCFSSTPTSSNFKTSLFIVTFVLNYVNINTSRSGNMIYISENMVFYIFKLVPLFKYTRQAIEKNRMSLNKAINKVLRMRNPQIINNQDDTGSGLSINKLKESGYSNMKAIEITSPIKELLEKFEGYWVLLRSNSDSLQEINAALGVSWFIRRAVDKLNPIVHYDVDTLRGIVSISTTLIMGLNNRTTLIINKTKNLGKNSLEEIENHRIEEFKMEEESSDHLSLSHDEGGLYRQYSNRRKKSFEKYLVFEQPNTTLEWSEDRTNIILETRQNREGFRMIETRSIVPSYKLPFKIKGNDGKIIENRRQDVLCYKIILKGGGKRNFNNKNNLLVCCRYFVKTEVVKPNDSDSNYKGTGLQEQSSKSKGSILTNSSSEIQSSENIKPYFIGELNEFPLTIQQLINDEDNIFKIVIDKRTELLEYTRKLVSEIDDGANKWSLERNSNGMRVYKREIDGQPFMSCGVTSILLNSDVQPFEISSTNHELENTNRICSIKDIVDYIWDSNNKMYYDPMVEKSDPMHYFRNDENICIFYQAFKGQWGVSGRDFVVICYRFKPDANESTDSDESQYEYILTQSIEWPVINSSYVRAKNYFATYVFRPEGENKVQALYFNQVDLHTDISAWIIKRVILDQMNSLTMLRDIIQKK